MIKTFNVMRYLLYDHYVGTYIDDYYRRDRDVMPHGRTLVNSSINAFWYNNALEYEAGTVSIGPHSLLKKLVGISSEYDDMMNSHLGLYDD